MPALLLLDPYVDVILALALAWLSLKIVQALFGPLSAIPAIGHAIDGLIHTISQSVSNACGNIAANASNIVGTSFHTISRFIDHTYGQFRSHARAILEAATIIGALAAAVHALRALVHRLEHAGHGVTSAVKTLEKEYHGIEHRVKDLERKVAHGIGHDLRIRIKALEKEYDGLRDGVIPDLRSAVKAAEGDLTSLRDWLGVKAGVNYKDWAVALATTLLAAVGLGGLRCNGLINSLNNRGCGFWNGIEDLLGLFVDTLLLTNVCELVPVLESAVSAVADPLVIALTDIGAGLCSGGIGPSPALQVPALSLPANPGFTLNLP